MEIKWTMIALAVLFGSVAVSEAVVSISHNDCKQVYALSDRTAEDILKICGK